MSEHTAINTAKPQSNEARGIIMWLPALGLISGSLLGAILALSIPPEYTAYLAVAILAGSDALLGGWIAFIKKNFDGAVLLSGFFVNTIAAFLLTILGDIIGTDLYLAAAAAFILRILKNIGSISLYAIEDHRLKKHIKRKMGLSGGTNANKA